MRVTCEAMETEVDGDYGLVDGVEVTCSRCGHTTESAGTHQRSIKRCLALLREECPEGENNFYVVPDIAEWDD